jgi:hypothetical protein
MCKLSGGESDPARKFAHESRTLHGKFRGCRGRYPHTFETNIIEALFDFGIGKRAHRSGLHARDGFGACAGGQPEAEPADKIRVLATGVPGTLLSDAFLHASNCARKKRGSNLLPSNLYNQGTGDITRYWFTFTPIFGGYTPHQLRASLHPYEI